MAGIGFELRKIQQKNSYISDLAAYVYGAMVSSGPWLMSVLCLAVLGVTGTGLLEKSEGEIFRTTVVYTYAASLIFIGIFQLVTTRHLADTLFNKDLEKLSRSYVTILCVVLCTGFPLGTLAVSLLQLSFFYKLITLLLFLTVCSLWIQMIFLSALKDYRTIFYAFVLGTGTSVLSAWLFETYWGLEGFLFGYTLGQAALMFLLLGKILTELPLGKEFWDKTLLQAFSTYKDLAVIGLIYNLAIWIDKILFWSAPDSRLITPMLRAHDLYDSPVFLAYLTIVPAMSMFMIKAETTFYEHYLAYYAKIMERHNLKTILAEKHNIIRVINTGARELLLVQGGLTLVCILFAPQIAETARLSPIQVPLLRTCLVGAFLQALLTMLTILLFYFEFRKSVLVVTSVFLLGNWGLSSISITLGLPYYGYGYCYSCLLALLAGLYLLSKGIRDLEYLTFAKQPIV
jgi:uncharacterized membrane protein